MTKKADTPTSSRVKKPRQSYFVYLLLCEDGSYYTGYTKNVESRFERHRKGLGARYTRMYRPKEIVYVKAFSSRVAAMRMERKIKTLSHQAKHDLALAATDSGALTP
jgi:putative endonuclease